MMRDPFKLTFLILAIIASMYFAAEVLQPLALAVLLSFALMPIARFLEARGLPRAVAVVLTLVVALGSLGVVGYVVGRQLTSLAYRLPDYRENILAKLSVLQPTRETTLQRVQKVTKEVAEKLDEPAVPSSVAQARRTGAGGGSGVEVQDVRVVEQPSFTDSLQGMIGPLLEPLALGSIVFVLMLILMLDRDDLSDRIIQLVGPRHISLTTRTMQEIAQRISQFLAIFAFYNAFIGVVLGLGLWAIGVEYAVLWGFLAAVMRFVPYVGPVVAFTLPALFSVAHFPTWQEPILVVVLFAVVEGLSNGILETIVFGRTTGISAMGLMVAAMFWTWLWGAVGLMLSTPMTLCLAVLGKYVPSLRFFAALLGEEADLAPDVRFYQRLVTLDREGALVIAAAAMKQQPRAEFFDRVLVPALSRAERDAERDELGDAEQEFIWRVVDEVLDELEKTPEQILVSASSSVTGFATGDGAAEPATEPVSLVGVAVQDTSDALVLRMLGLLLSPSGCTLEIIRDTESPLQVADQVAGLAPKLVVVSHLPPAGLKLARYLVSRLRARFADLPIVVGRWGETGGGAAVAERLTGVGATHVLFTLADARDRIL